MIAMHVLFPWALFCIVVKNALGLENVALLKNTYQSSRGTDSGYSWTAVDGCAESHWDNACGCTHTDTDAGAWWTVDLGLESTIEYIDVLNRGDCCAERLSNFKIYAMSEDPDPNVATDKVECYHYTGQVQDGGDGFEQIDCSNPVTGRYLSIQLQGTNALTLCEVKVWAESHNHFGPTWNYAEGATVHMTDDGNRWRNNALISSFALDNDHATCTNGVEVTQDGQITVEMPHDVAVEKVRIYQSPNCPYFCSTQVDLRAWGNDDPGAGNGAYIKINGTDQGTSQGRGWFILILDECACEVKDTTQIDHFSADQQVGCMDTTGAFVPYIDSLDVGDYFFAVSKDEVSDGIPSCYQYGLDLLNVASDYSYRDAIAIIAKKGYPEFTRREMTTASNGPLIVDGVYVGASPTHVFTAGVADSALAASLSTECGSYDGLVGEGQAGSLTCGSPVVGTYFQLNFPDYGVNLCEIELFLGNMAEFCGSSDSDPCWYIPSRKWDTTADGEWECRAQYANANLAEVTSAHWTTVSSQLSSNSDLNNVGSVMVGAENGGSGWTYVDSGASVPASVYGSQASGILYMNNDGTEGSSVSGGGTDHYVLCEVSKDLYQGSSHVVFRVAAGDDSQGSIYTTWTETSITPDLDTPGYITHDVTAATFFKSPIIDCAWDYVKEVRVSFYKDDVEAGFMNFNVPSGQSKTQFFTTLNLMGSAWTDMDDVNTLSMEGYTSGSASRRFLFEKSSDSCNSANTEEAWMMMLDTDHTSCADFDTDQTDLPVFLYSDNYPSVTTGSNLRAADTFVIAVLLDEDTFGGECVSSCAGVSDGQYQSCFGCNVYVDCTSNTLTYYVCRATEKWQATSYGVGSCESSSSSCTQPDADQTCNPDGCSSGPCQNGGTCSMVAEGGWECECTVAYMGVDCSTEVDECASDPCQHSGTCEDAVGSYTCTCDDTGYEGTLCETEIDECASDPCQNGGACNDQVAQYDCTCAAGYEDTHCETDIDECASDPCQNGAACNDAVNSYTCTCADGYEGTHCEVNIDECASDPCQNGGACTDAVNSYTCACADGYEGDQCETDIDECASSPCQNSGVCNDAVNSYTCDCADGYTDTHCETDIDDCASDPCQNGGTCTDQVNAFDCACAVDTYGELCQTDPCDPNPCQLNGTCAVDESDPYDISFTCTCMASLSGDTCNEGPCQDNPDSCQNGATCTNALHNETAAVAECECAPGYEGDDCSEEDGTLGSSDHQSGGNGNDKLSATSGILWITVVSVVAGLAAIVLLAFLIRRSMKKKSDESKEKDTETAEIDPEGAMNGSPPANKAPPTKPKQGGWTG